MAASGTAQYADIQKLLDSSAVILAKILIKRDLGEEMPEAEWEEAVAEIKRLHREVREKLSENRRRMAKPSGAAQYADIQKLLDSSAVILAKIQLKRDLGEEMPEAEREEAVAEIKRLHREVREKLSENRRRMAMAKQLCAGFLVGFLGALALSTFVSSVGAGGSA